MKEKLERPREQAMV